MTDYARIVKAVIYFIYGTVFMVVGYYVIPPMIGFLPQDYMKAIFWMGLITLFLLAMIYFPFREIIGGKNDNK